jgi:hypothetical protein
VPNIDDELKKLSDFHSAWKKHSTNLQAWEQLWIILTFRLRLAELVSVHMNSQNQFDKGMKAYESSHDRFCPHWEVQLRSVETQKYGDHCNAIKNLFAVGHHMNTGAKV